MTGLHLLDAIGLLDDELIREAEAYQPPQRNYRPWISLAACLAVVLALGYGAVQLGMFSMGGGAASGNGMSGGAANAPAASAPAGSSGWTTEAPPSETAEGPDNSGTQGGEAFPSDHDAPVEGESLAIMVDGVLYRSTGEAVPGEPDLSAIQTVVSYTNGTPEMDGQTNFSQDLSARYAVTDLGVVVLVEEEWILFEPVE